MATDFDPRFDQAFQRGYEAPPVDPEAALAEPPRRRNPWLATLWILSLVLLTSGIAGYAWARLVTNPTAQATLVVYPAIVDSLAPWVAVVGMLGVVLAVYVHANQWRRG